MVFKFNKGFLKVPLALLLVGLPVICLLGMADLAISHADDAGTGMTKAVKVGSETCLECHDAHAEKAKSGKHSLVAGGSKVVGCEDCHGPGSAHAESEDPMDILHGENRVEWMQMNCTACHSNFKNSWKEQKMMSAGMNCMDCHAVHQAPAKGSLKKPESELCATCHIQEFAKTKMPSHHPMGKGKMECSTCHDMTGKTIFKAETPNDKCLSCHAQYRGPFVFEHAPVAEDCTICHDPHGSVADNMLKQNEPFLCLACHQMHFHTQLPGYEGDFEAPLFPGRTGHSERDSLKKAFLTKCTSCHAPVHGSDSSSQGISSYGKSLTR